MIDEETTDEHPVVVMPTRPTPSREPVTVPETPDSIKKSDRPKEPTP